MSRKYHCHIDFIHLSFQTVDFRYFNDIESNHYKVKQITGHKDYHNTYIIYFTPNTSSQASVLARVNLKHATQHEYSTITLTNEALHSLNWLDVLNTFIYDFKLNVRIRKIELATDTNTNILKKIYNNYKRGNIKIKKKKYEFNNFGRTKNIFMHTLKYYFENLATQKLYDDTSTNRSCFDRFENKTQELIDKNHKKYILPYLSQYLDTEKTVYRFEKTIFYEDLSYSNAVYVSEITGETLSQHFYDKLLATEKMNYIKHFETSVLDIDFGRLMDSDYLISIFNHFTIFNHEIILDTFKSKSKFRAKYTKKYNIVKPNNRKIKLIENQKLLSKIHSELDHVEKIYNIQSNEYDLNPSFYDLQILFNTPIPNYCFDYPAFSKIQNDTNGLRHFDLSDLIDDLLPLDEALKKFD